MTTLRRSLVGYLNLICKFRIYFSPKIYIISYIGYCNLRSCFPLLSILFPHYATAADRPSYEIQVPVTRGSGAFSSSATSSSSPVVVVSYHIILVVCLIMPPATTNAERIPCLGAVPVPLPQIPIKRIIYILFLSILCPLSPSICMCGDFEYLPRLGGWQPG